MTDPLLPPHGGYRKLKSFQIAQLVYDMTVLFCDRYVDKFSRTRDQMVQAARSGVQNIAEGSQVSGTSKKSELKLTNVARGSLEELRLDYEDFLRQRSLPQLHPDDPVLQRFKARQCKDLSEIRQWVMDERSIALAELADTAAKETKSPTLPSSALAANAALSLLNLACYLLSRQLVSQASAFEKNGGFTERLYNTRKNRKYGHNS